MLSNRTLTPKLAGVIGLLTLLCLLGSPELAKAQTETTTRKDTLPFPISDRRGDPFSETRRNSFDLQRPANITDSVAYDPVTKRYIVYEKIGNRYYRTPTWYTFDEFVALQGKRAEAEYFRKRANTLNLLNRGRVKPKLSIGDNLFNRLFGNGKIEIQPQGNVDITAGYQGQNIKNPTLPERARRNGGFDFDMAAQVNVNANIGDKLKFPISYNTLANFDFSNQLKLDYSGLEDEIVKRFEAGNVSFPSKSTLIPGAQSLFGLKTQLQFGKLFITTVFANQKSQRQSVNLQGGASSQLFELKADEYEENRHFLLAQYFRNTYNRNMANLPASKVSAPVNILRMEVWVTNRNGTTTEARDIVGLANLAEGSGLPANNANNLYADITGNPNSRNPALVTNQLLTLGLQPVQDFEKTFARKLDSTQYIYNPKIGFISLNQPLQPDEVLAVAYQYTNNGRVFQVGEFSQDLPPDTTTANQKVLFLKLLKATSQRPSLPIWDLMMKNVYSVGFGTLERQDFRLDVLYQEPGLGAKRYVPFGNANEGTPIITLLNLDRLNNQNDPQPDGVFDFVEGFTVIPQYSRIIFPVLEPFGRDLAERVYTPAPPANVRDTLFYALYDSIKVIAQQFPNLNRFVLKGSARTSSSSDISIGYNIPPGSVTVTAGGQVLSENIDYIINYDLGTIKIINAAITNAGLPVQVNFENNATFGIQQRNYMALRLDYLAKNTQKTQLALGATIVRLGERPFFTKVDYGEDPIRNTMYGADITYRRDVPRLTKLLDKLPFYTTTAPSTVSAYIEAAYLKPGHAPQIGRGDEGLVYIDNFEGSKSSIDLRFPAISWALASTPALFPESRLNNNLDYGRNRAKLAWYQIEPTLQDVRSPNNPLSGDRAALSDPRVRAVLQSEIFPQRTTGFGDNQLITFDLAYYPRERGPYNFDATPGRVTADNRFTNPRNRWGGLMRAIDQTDFETGNVEFIEAWIQDPFINNPTATGGKFFINLGNISEDVLKDSRRFYENGLPTPNAPSPVDTSIWGKVPRNPIQVTNAFSNNPEDRPFQDVGFDGLRDEEERVKRQNDYLAQLQTNFGTASRVYQDALADPSSDNYEYYRGNQLDARRAGILERYKNFNSPNGNSPVSTTNSEFSSAATLYPDQEDLNRDNTMNETEEYFQYEVDLRPPTSPQMSIGTNFIVDKKVVPVKLANGQTRNETWYQFRIPVNAYQSKVGNIPDFKSIRFMRMFLTDFDDTVVVRFGKLDLVRNIWRRFNYRIDSLGTYSPVPFPTTMFNVGAVNIEENDKRTPLPYRTPKDIERVQTLSNNGVNLLQNEQAIQLQVCDLQKRDARGVVQTFANRDLRQFKRLRMYVHAERPENSLIEDDDMTAIFRVGTDFVSNYYEVRIPLKLTKSTAARLNPNSDQYNDSLWNPANSLDLDLTVLTKMKSDRNLSNQPLNKIYRRVQSNGHTYSIMGNPNLGEIRGILLGVENTEAEVACGEVWFNELRLSSLDEEGGFAALGRVDVTLADLGSLSLSMNAHTKGFGTLEQRVNERYRDNFLQFDANATLELGKLLPKKSGISIPVYAGYSQTVSTPEYDPYDLDIKLKDKLNSAQKGQRDSIRKDAVDFTSIKTLNFTNVRKNKTNGKKPKPWDISNVDLSYSYVKTEAHNPLIENNEVTKHRGGVGYNYAPQPKYFEPFKKLIKSKTHWFDLIKDFNINPLPSQVSFKADIYRQFGAVRPRSVGATGKYKIPETYEKYFTFDRNYILRWDLTRSFNIDYTALNNARVDEPFGRLDTKAKKDTVRENFWKGGRNVVFNQAVNFSYNVPTSKFPLLDWTTVRLRYGATYRWIGASRLAVELGNILENGQQQEANVQFDFTKLYGKSKLLRSLEQPVQPKAQQQPQQNQNQTAAIDTTTKKGKRQAKRLANNPGPKKPAELRGVSRFLGKLLTSVKTVNMTLSENSNTRLPGYMDSTQHFGQNFKSMAPGFDFILGRQPDTTWLNNAARRGLISKDSMFNDLFTQSFDQRFTISAQLEPLRDLTIDVNVDKTFNKNYTELFKDTTGLGSNFAHLSPYAGGGFNVSYIAFNTLFEKYDPNRISATFIKFQDNRRILSERLAKLNPYNSTLPNNGLRQDGYYIGYGRYAIDVLIPSFIAAYTGKDPQKVELIEQNNRGIKSNPFRAILPKPNWRLTYNGLTSIKGMEKIFTSFSLSHGYTGSLSMNSFTSALLYQDVSRFGFPSFIDTLSNNYVPYFLVPNVTIQEQFSPLLGVDFQLTNQVSGKFEYVKQRQLSLSLIDFQLSEVRSTEFTVGAGFRKRGLKLPFSIPVLMKKGDKKLDNELNVRFDFKVRDNVTSNSRLDQESAFATNGSKEITISPTIDYYISNRINVKLYFDQRRVNPYISSAAPTVNTRAGLQIRISLTQ